MSTFASPFGRKAAIPEPSVAEGTMTALRRSEKGPSKLVAVPSTPLPAEDLSEQNEAEKIRINANAQVRKDVDTYEDEEENTHLRKDVDAQERIDVNTVIRKDVSTQIRKKVHRNFRVNLKIQEKHGKILERLAYKNDLFLADIIEQLLENAEIRKNVNTSDTYNKERARQKIDDKERLIRNDDNHHLQSVQRYYTELSHKSWQGKDDVSYRQIADIPLLQIIAAMREVKKRAVGVNIGSFGYFVKGILNELERVELPPQTLSQDAEYREHVIRFISLNDGDDLRNAEKRRAYIESRCLEEGDPYNDGLARSIASEGL